MIDTQHYKTMSVEELTQELKTLRGIKKQVVTDYKATTRALADIKLEANQLKAEKGHLMAAIRAAKALLQYPQALAA